MAVPVNKLLGPVSISGSGHPAYVTVPLLWKAAITAHHKSVTVDLRNSATPSSATQTVCRGTPPKSVNFRQLFVHRRARQNSLKCPPILALTYFFAFRRASRAQGSLKTAEKRGRPSITYDTYRRFFGVRTATSDSDDGNIAGICLSAYGRSVPCAENRAKYAFLGTQVSGSEHPR